MDKPGDEDVKYLAAYILLKRSIRRNWGCRPSNAAIGVRDFFKTYVNSFEGSLPWLWDHVRSRGNVKK